MDVEGGVHRIGEPVEYHERYKVPPGDSKDRAYVEVRFLTRDKSMVAESAATGIVMLPGTLDGDEGIQGLMWGNTAVLSRMLTQLLVRAAKTGFGPSLEELAEGILEAMDETVTEKKK